MKKKDILELKKRLKKDYCTFSKICGCYVNGEKHTIFKFRDTFLNLDEDEYFKYLEISKKVLSGTVGNNLLELNFPLDEDLVNEKQMSLMQLKNSGLKDDELLDEFYNSIIESYDYTGNFLILLFHDTYDVITKTKDNRKLDESEEVYEYILCALCPVTLTDPGLRYFEDENKIKSRVRDWIVENPINGFVFPAFNERSSDVNSIIYYTKNAKDTHPELMEEALGCSSKQTATLQKETFESIIKDSFSADEEKADKVFMEIQDTLNIKIEEYKSIYADKDAEPIVLTKNEFQNILLESGISEEITTKIEETYLESFGEDVPLAENLVDQKVLKAHDQIKKEESLKKQVETLQTRLEEVTQEVALTREPSVSEDEESEFEEQSTDYDIIVKVNPEKVSQIKSQIIDGQKYIIIPVNENEQTTVNGLDDLI